MQPKKAIIALTEEIEEFSRIINTHDETGNANADLLIKRLAVAAALAFNKAKVKVAAITTAEDEFISALNAALEMAKDWYSDPKTYDIVKSACSDFTVSLADQLILGVPQEYTPVFSQINEDLSLTFLFLEGEADDSNPDGVSASS